MLKEPCMPQGFSELKAKLLEWLLKVHYSDSTKCSYILALSRLETYMTSIGTTAYTVEIGRTCIDEKYLQAPFLGIIVLDVQLVRKSGVAPQPPNCKLLFPF